MNYWTNPQCYPQIPWISAIPGILDKVFKYQLLIFKMLIKFCLAQNSAQSYPQIT